MPRTFLATRLGAVSPKLLVIGSDDAAAAVDHLTSRIANLGAVMQAHADAPPLAPERAGEPRWRQALARSPQERCDVREFDKCEIGRDAYPPVNGGIGISVVVASIWLTFFIIAVAHSLASGN